ncbi:hypothetical protein AB0E62_01550 [Streptomyces sp. NPDC038707]|uniref:hypothetical protein n=1 Tax=unclassified Streptomyces TaxID=2593676 RepID=UPI0033EEE128
MGIERGPADDCPEAEVAADPGDGDGPADDDAAFTAFATAVAGTWPRGDRARIRSAGPVPGSRFA